MYNNLQPKLNFTQERKRILQDTVIGQDEPGTILHDFNAVLRFIRTNKLILTPTHQLTLTAVKALNQLFQHPVELALKRPSQKYYPPVHGLYLLLRASGLTLVDPSGKQPALQVDEAAYSQWLRLSETEQYFSLFEAWLLRGYGEIVGENRRFMPDALECVMSFVQFEDLEKGIQVAGSVMPMKT
jgi:hypothetical protein